MSKMASVVKRIKAYVGLEVLYGPHESMFLQCTEIFGTKPTGEKTENL